MKIDEIALFVFGIIFSERRESFFKWTKEGENMGKKQPLYQSFRYAFEGIFTGIRKERNMKIHCLGVICVTAAGFFFDISATEWLYLSDFVWSDSWFGTCKYCGGGSS